MILSPFVVSFSSFCGGGGGGGDLKNPPFWTTGITAKRWFRMPAICSLISPPHRSPPPRRTAGDPGTQALAALHKAPSLHTLHLDLSLNQLRAAGAQALAALKATPALHTLHLDLKVNQVGTAGVQALAALRDAPALRTLYLDLSSNEVSRSPPHLRPLAALPSAPGAPGDLALCIRPLLSVQKPPPPGGGGGSGTRWRGGGGGRSPPPRLQGAQPMPSHCSPDGKCQPQWHL